ncbi:MAG: hypothetical protein CME33_09450 [Gimesia sp.]|nr:hypothetical protein [Gimesia sp.]
MTTCWFRVRLSVYKSFLIRNRERKVTTEFLRLKSHFLFDDHFCLVRRPNEKGHIERLLDYARRNFLVPVPSGCFSGDPQPEVSAMPSAAMENWSAFIRSQN